MPIVNVLYEDNHLLVVDKPAGIATMGAPRQPTVHGWACEYLKRKYAKPGNVFVGIVSRLDRMTSGVLVLARTSKAAGRLSAQFRTTAIEKRYLAVVEGDWPEEKTGRLVDWIWKDQSAHRMRCRCTPMAGAQEAILSARSLQRLAGRTLMSVRLETGRKHQIRAQFSSRGHAVWGDQKYGATSRFCSGIALHAWRLTLQHPTLRTKMTFSVAPPTHWASLGFALHRLDKLHDLPD